MKLTAADTQHLFEALLKSSEALKKAMDQLNTYAPAYLHLREAWVHNRVVMSTLQPFQLETELPPSIQGRIDRLEAELAEAKRGNAQRDLILEDSKSDEEYPECSGCFPGCIECETDAELPGGAR